MTTTLTQLLPALHDELAERIAGYTVGITKINMREQAEVPEKSGSGTLISFQGREYIITADHVVEDIAQCERVGLLVDWTGQLRRCAFERNHLEFARIPRGKVPDAGPDLAAILLPATGEAMSTLRSIKSFYNLDRRMEKFREAFPPLNQGFWLPCGVLAEGSIVLPSERGFKTVQGYQGLCGIAGAPQESLRDGFDYLDLVSDQSASQDMPRSFEGLSGGGLWQALIHSRDGALHIDDLILSGTLFYQHYLEGGRRSLRSHGRISLYQRLPEEIQKKFQGRS